MFLRTLVTLLVVLCLSCEILGQSSDTDMVLQKSVQDCRCAVKMMTDFMDAHSWSEISLIRTDDEDWFSKGCLRGNSHVSLLKQVWRRGGIIRVIRRKDAVTLMSSGKDLSNRAFLMMNSNSTRSFLTMINDEDLFSTTSWVILSNTGQSQSLTPVFSSLMAFIPSNIFVLDYQQCFAKVSSLYRVGPRVTEVQKEIGGTWQDSFGFVGDPLSTNKLDRRKDFKGYPIRGVGVNVFDFFTTYLPNDAVSGFVGDLVTTLKFTHNFTLSYKILEGYAYGKLTNAEKNQWNGMVGELQSKRADLTVSELSITQERSEVVTYTQPIRVISRKLFVALSEDNQKKILTYFTPMEPTVYVCLFFSMSTMAVSLMLSDKAVHKYMPDRYSDNSTPLGTAIWSIFSALMQQSCVTQPLSTSPRIIFLFSFVVSLLVYTAYSATLLSHIAVAKPVTLPFTNLFELSKLSGWDAGCNRDDLFQVTASQTCAHEPRSDECQTLFDVWNKNVMRSDENLVPNYVAGLKRALKGNYVFIGVGVTTRYYIRKMPVDEACKIRELPGMYIQGGIGIGLQHKSPFQMSFDDTLQRVREMGLMDKLVKLWLSREEICDSTSALTSADIIDVSSLFVLFITGLCVSLITLGFERCKKRMSKKKKSSEYDINVIE